MLESVHSRASRGILALEEGWLVCTLGLEGECGPARRQLQLHAIQPGPCSGQSNSAGHSSSQVCWWDWRWV